VRIRENYKFSGDEDFIAPNEIKRRMARAYMMEGLQLRLETDNLPPPPISVEKTPKFLSALREYQIEIRPDSIHVRLGDPYHFWVGCGYVTPIFLRN
jgi:hypothetical protein